MTRTRVIGSVAALGYVGTVVAANAAVQHYGIIPVGFGYSAPAGVYFVALALVLRDYVQWSLGKPIMLAALATGAVASYAVASPALASASAAAFAFSELVDFALFTWLAPRWARAVLIGGIVGAVIDSAIFLRVAFGSFDFMQGQVLGKAYGIVAAALIVAALRTRREPVPA